MALSGPAAAGPDISLATNIQRLHLPAYKRRALVLAAVELVTSALLHAFPGRAGGRIGVSLTTLGSARAWLEVKDDGVAAGLADLLDADLSYFRGNAMTIAEVVFPVSDHRAFRQ